jgi:putative zinc finger protein
MNCERVAQLLPDYLQGNLGHDEDDQLEDHFQQCTNCAQEAALWKDLAHLPVAQPGEALRANFEAMLVAYREGRREQSRAASKAFGRWFGWSVGDWLRPAIAGVAAALALLVAGFYAGRYGSAGNAPQLQAQSQLAEMRTELGSMRQLMVLSMLQQQSATERLQGVSYSTQDAHLDPQILAALVHTLRYDASVDVRLAALDALSRHGNQPQVRTGLVDALEARQSPLVQIALIDLLVELHDAGARGQLQRFQQDLHVDRSVRERAAWALSKLS